MKGIVFALALLVADSASARRFGIFPDNDPRGPWQAPTLKSYPAATALEEARSRFLIVNRYAHLLPAWRLDVQYENARSIDSRRVARDPVWGPWVRLWRETETKGSELSFGSERREPGSFFVDGQVRIAKTGSRPGSPILVNEDLIVHEGADGNPEPMEWGQVLSILLHEHGHHLEAFGLHPTHAELDDHAAKVRNYLERDNRSYEYGALPPEPELPRDQRPRVDVLGFRQTLETPFFCEFRMLIVRDSERLFDVSPLVDKVSGCSDDNWDHDMGFADRHFVAYNTVLTGFRPEGPLLIAGVQGTTHFHPRGKLELEFEPRAEGGFRLRRVR